MRNRKLLRLWRTWVVTYYNIMVAWSDVKIWAISQRQQAIDRAWKRHYQRRYKDERGRQRHLWFRLYTNTLYRLEKLPSGIIYALIMRRLP